MNNFQSRSLTLLASSFLLISNLAFASPSTTQTDPDPVPLDEVKRFSNAISQIKNYYVKPVKDKALFDGAIKGMLQDLDPHSAYLDEDDFRELQTSTRGQFGGLGLEVTMEDGIVKVVTPLDDTPAAKAGIEAGDYIIRLNNKPVKGLSLKEAVNQMRGKKGTKIVLTVVRKDAKKNPLTFTLVRDEIRIKSVKAELYENDLGYIRISHFQSLTAKDMLKSIKKLRQKSRDGKLKGLVLDLRNNPGGLLDSAIDVSDAFISNDQKGSEEIIVYTEGRLPGSKFTAFANPGDILNEAPIVVLINQGSASGSEIVAGALKDHKRALVLGTKSFGKGSVQTVLPLDEKHGIKLTTALYYTPLGTSIQAKGVSPNIIVENIKIANEKEKESISESLQLSEADLSGHLENGNGATKNPQKGSVAKGLSSQELIYKDYQLHQAFTLLKGMTATD
jgi:carboxyl-terminal processing protease